MIENDALSDEKLDYVNDLITGLTSTYGNNVKIFSVYTNALFRTLIPMVEHEGIARTDGVYLHVGDEWWGFDVGEQAFIIIHELYHVLLKHPWLGGEIYIRNPDSYNHDNMNIAMDFVVNYIVIRYYEGVEFTFRGKAYRITQPKVGAFYKGDKTVFSTLAFYLSLMLDESEARDALNQMMQGELTSTTAQNVSSNVSKGKANLGEIQKILKEIMKGQSEKAKEDIQKLSDQGKISQEDADNAKKAVDKIAEDTGNDPNKIQGQMAQGGWLGQDVNINTQPISEKERRIIERTQEDVSKSAGSGYGSMRDIMVENKRSVPIGWVELLKNYIRASLGTPYDWTYNRVREYSGINASGGISSYNFPTLTGITVKLDVGVDTSGSITQSDLKSFMNVVNSIVTQVHATGKLYLFHDGVYADYRLPHDLTKIKAESGGTKINDLFIRARKDNVKVLIVITDGFFDKSFIRQQHWPFQTIWVITRNGDTETLPFGKIIQINF